MFPHATHKPLTTAKLTFPRERSVSYSRSTLGTGMPLTKRFRARPVAGVPREPFVSRKYQFQSEQQPRLREDCYVSYISLIAANISPIPYRPARHPAAQVRNGCWIMFPNRLQAQAQFVGFHFLPSKRRWHLVAHFRKASKIRGVLDKLGSSKTGS